MEFAFESQRVLRVFDIVHGNSVLLVLVHLYWLLELCIRLQLITKVEVVPLAIPFSTSSFRDRRGKGEVGVGCDSTILHGVSICRMQMM
jgi:hypothetical protein